MWREEGGGSHRFDEKDSTALLWGGESALTYYRERTQSTVSKKGRRVGPSVGSQHQVPESSCPMVTWDVLNSQV